MNHILFMSLIISLVIAVTYYFQMGSFLSKKENTYKEKGIEGITPRLLLDRYRKTGLPDEQIIDKLIKSCQNGRKLIPLGTILIFTLVFILNFFLFKI